MKQHERDTYFKECSISHFKRDHLQHIASIDSNIQEALKHACKRLDRDKHALSQLIGR